MSDWQPWLLLILVLVVLALVIWWWWKSRSRAPVVTPPASAPSVVTAKCVLPDDLTLVEGIGPKTVEVLAAAGITTFAGLAASDPGKLLEILRAAGLRLGDPSTWPQQAGLAAAGKMDALKALQDSLKGGRRV